jgi:hypothetical protein
MVRFISQLRSALYPPRVLRSVLSRSQRTQYFLTCRTRESKRPDLASSAPQIERACFEKAYLTLVTHMGCAEEIQPLSPAFLEQYPKYVNLMVSRLKMAFV